MAARRPWRRPWRCSTRWRSIRQAGSRAWSRPSQIDTCTAELIQASFREAEKRAIPFQIHAAQSVVEFHELTRRQGMTPIEWLESLGVLSPRSIIGHGIYLDHHSSALNWPKRDDLGALIESGTSVAHCPVVFQRRGIAIQSVGGYLRRGLNIGIGTDTFPPQYAGGDARRGYRLTHGLAGRLGSAALPDLRLCHAGRRAGAGARRYRADRGGSQG